MSEYRFIKNKFLAVAIRYLTQEDFYKYKDGYSFKNTKKFRKAMDMLQLTKSEIMKM